MSSIDSSKKYTGSGLPLIGSQGYIDFSILAKVQEDMSQLPCALIVGDMCFKIIVQSTYDEDTGLYTNLSRQLIPEDLVQSDKFAQSKIDSLKTKIASLEASMKYKLSIQERILGGEIEMLRQRLKHVEMISQTSEAELKELDILRGQLMKNDVELANLRKDKKVLEGEVAYLKSQNALAQGISISSTPTKVYTKIINKPTFFSIPLNTIKESNTVLDKALLKSYECNTRYFWSQVGEKPKTLRFDDWLVQLLTSDFSKDTSLGLVYDRLFCIQKISMLKNKSTGSVSRAANYTLKNISSKILKSYQSAQNVDNNHQIIEKANKKQTEETQ